MVAAGWKLYKNAPTIQSRDHLRDEHGLRSSIIAESHSSLSVTRYQVRNEQPRATAHSSRRGKGIATFGKFA